MNDLLEFIEDLDTLDTLKSHPAYEDTLEAIRAKYQARMAEFEAEMERQYNFNFLN
jgi:hypothetical protein